MRNEASPILASPLNRRAIPSAARLALVFLLSALWALGEADPRAARAQTPTPASLGGRIAFVSDRDGNTDIYTMNADGSDVTRLTNSPAVKEAPAWSPDGRRIAFPSNDGMYAMNADGSDVTRLTYGFYPSWSPDGQRIAFMSGWEIYAMNADGSGVTRLTNNPAHDSEPSWSPDGWRIAFESDRDGSNEIYVMNADGSDVTRLTGFTRLTNNRGLATASEPSWSPDGQRIAFFDQRIWNIDSRRWNVDIYTVNADGSDVARLTSDPETDWYPTWSPDGRRIAFSSNRDGNWEIYAMNADGSGVTRLTNNPADDSWPSWGPDSTPPRRDVAPTPLLPTLSSFNWEDDRYYGGTFYRGELLEAWVLFGEDVVVDTGGGNPTIELIFHGEVDEVDKDGKVVTAEYRSFGNESSRRLSFFYEIQAGDKTHGTNFVLMDSLVIPSGSSIKDAAGNSVPSPIGRVSSTYQGMVFKVDGTISPSPTPTPTPTPDLTATATAKARLTATARARLTATAKARQTATAKARATATARARLTATAKAWQTATAEARATAKARQIATAEARLTSTAEARTAEARLTVTARLAKVRMTRTATALTATAMASISPTPTPISPTPTPISPTPTPISPTPTPISPTPVSPTPTPVSPEPPIPTFTPTPTPTPTPSPTPTSELVRGLFVNSWRIPGEPQPSPTTLWERINSEDPLLILTLISTILTLVAILVQLVRGR